MEEKRESKFPRGFFWGAATSSHQVEGGCVNDWSEWEKANAERLAREAKGIYYEWQQEKFPEMFEAQNYISGKACDHYHLYEKDFDLARDLGHNAHRFSLEWSRIEPEEGKFDEKEIEHYRQVISALKARDMETFVTLWHWTLPLWLAKKGGTAASEFPFYFERFAEKIAETIGTEIKFWITLNEPDVQSAHAYLKKAWPPQKKNPFLYWKALRNLISAHQRTFAVIKKKYPHAQIGIAKHQIAFEVVRPTALNKLLKKLADWWWNEYFLNQIKNQQDFIGLNHYNRNVVNNGFYKNPNKIQTDFGWEYYPQSIYQALVELRRFGKPIYITENGIADQSDELRQKFIPAALAAVARAIANGVDVRGYLYWSLLDNFEWDKGFWPRFGLVEIDYKTLERKVRPSAQKYAEICRNNSLLEPY
jgi:beta-glucosidase